jgi:hypothetical protein
MPSKWHDSANELFRENPGLAGQILRELMGVDLPAELPLSLAPETFNDRPSRDLIADAVIIAGPARNPARGIIVEIQQDKRESKRRQWPRYAAALWLQHECPVDVLVICPDEETARWYAEPIRTTLDGYTHRPKVLLPGRVPAISSPKDVAANPALGVLSVAYHGMDRAVANAFVSGVGYLGGRGALQYYEYGYSMSPKAVCTFLEELVATKHWPVYSPFAKEHYGKGREEGLAEGLVRGERDKILLTLRLRGLDVTDSQREHISTCADLDQLREWSQRALTATATSDLFE